MSSPIGISVTASGYSTSFKYVTVMEIIESAIR